LRKFYSYIFNIVFKAKTKASNPNPADNSSNATNQNGNFAKAPSSSNHGGENSGEELIKVFLGETNQMPNFGTVNLENIQLPHNCTLDDVKTFEELYKQHCDVSGVFFYFLHLIFAKILKINANLIRKSLTWWWVSS
jgi:hypothetical protein